VGNAAVSLIALAIMITSLMAILNSIFEGNQKSSRAFLYEAGALAEQARASVSVVSATAFNESAGSDIDITVRNTGAISYGDFRDWDINVEYLDGAQQLNSQRLGYAEATTQGAWTVQGIYRDASASTAEIIGPDVLDAGEEAVLRLSVTPAIQAESTGRVVVTPPIGGTASAFFNG
jgi:hypothetical protein